MTPLLLFPAGLAALAALLLPLLIHLARKSEQRPTDFAALRWLEARPRPRHRIRFDEWPLLLVRLLLLALVALWLARPVLPGAEGGRPMIAVVPGAAPPPASDTADIRWLAPGFPPATAPAPPGPLPVASLLRQLDAELPPAARLTVLVPAILDGADAERPRLSRPVEWRILPGAMPAATAARAAPPALAIHAAPGQDGGVRYLRAAALAWTPPGRPPRVVIATADTAPPAGTILVRLAAGPLPPAIAGWVRQGHTALVSAATPVAAATPLWRDAAGVPLAEQAALGRGRVIRFTRSLAPATMPELLEADFPVRLRALLDPPVPPPSRVRAADYRPLAGAAPYPQSARDLRPWAALAIAALLLVERWLATRRRRGVAP